MQQPIRVYRMSLPEHECPWGLKTVALLKSHQLTFEDHLLTSREQVDAFKAEHQVKTTPQIFFGDQRVGGYTDLAERLGEKPKMEDTSYLPVIAIFSSTALMALSLTYGGSTSGVTLDFFDVFMAFSLCVLAVLKLMDLPSFTESFLKYDLLTERVPVYAKVYPFIELLVGLGILSGLFGMGVAILALLVGLIGSISVIKAVYIDKMALNCACVGGNSKVPLGAVSLTENVMMVLMGMLMLVRMFPAFA